MINLPFWGYTPICRQTHVGLHVNSRIMLIVMCCYNEIVPVVKPVSLQGPARPTGRPAKAFQPPMSLVPAGLSISPLVQAGPASPILPGFPGLPASVGPYGPMGFLPGGPSFKIFPQKCLKCCFPTALLTPPPWELGKPLAQRASAWNVGEKLLRLHLWGDHHFPKNAGPQNLKQNSGTFWVRLHGMASWDQKMPGWTI